MITTSRSPTRLRRAAHVAPMLLLTLLAGCVAGPDWPTWDEMNAATVVSVSRVSTLRADSSWSEDLVTASFAEEGRMYLSAGRVTVAGVAIPSRALDAGGVGYRLEGPTPQLPLELDGRRIAVVVEGSAQVPALVDSVATPNPATAILAPSLSDTVAADSGIVVRWSGDGASRVDVMLVPFGRVESARTLRDVGDGGVLHVTAAQTRGFPPGRLLVLVQRTRTTEGRRTDGRRYVLEVSSVASVETTVR